LKSTTWHRLIAAISIIAILQVACGQQYTRVRLDGYSMEPNFTDGDVFRIIEVPLTELKRGDLVLVEIDGTLLIKRLIGLPNETISILDGKILIDGIPLVEPYEVKPPTYTVDEVKLDKDSFYVLGDNRPNSSDSHLWGAVQGSNIKGKAILDK
jgi:signal peptidase I